MAVPPGLAREVEALRLVRKGGLLTALLSGLWAVGMVASLLLSLFDAALAALLFLASAAAAYLFGYRWFYRGAKALEEVWPEADMIRLGALMYVLSPLLITILIGYILAFVVGSRRLHRRYGVEDFDTAFILFVVAIVLVVIPVVNLMSFVLFIGGLLTWYSGIGQAIERLQAPSRAPAGPAAPQG